MKTQGQSILKSPILQSLLAFSLVFSGSALFAPQFNDKNVLLRSAVLQVVLVFGVPFATSRWLKLDNRSVFKLERTGFKNLAFSILIAVSLVLILEETTVLQYQMFGGTSGQESQIRGLLKADSWTGLGWILLSMVAVPSFCEEFLFRGFIFNRLLQPNQIGQAIMLSSVLFGVFHHNLSTLFNDTLAGIILSLIILRSGSLLNCVLAHATINVSAVAFANSKVACLNYAARPEVHLPWGLSAAALAGLLLGVIALKPPIRKNSRLAQD